MKTLRQPDVLLRIAASLLVSFFIVMNGRWDRISNAFFSPYFYIAFVFSFVVSFFLLYLVRIGNTFLDQKFPWKSDASLALWVKIFKIAVRAVFQIVVCFIIPSLINLLIIALYFRLINSMFDVGDYLIHDFPIIALLLILLNCYYIIQQFRKVPVEIRYVMSEPNRQTMQLSRFDTFVTVDVARDVLYCGRLAKRVQIHLRDEQRFTVEDALRDLADQYEPSGLFQINRSIVINLAIVKGYEKGLRRDNLQLTIHDDYANLPSMQNSSLFVVTKEHIEAFKSKMDMRFDTQNL